MKRFAAIVLALGIASLARAEALPPGWSSPLPASYRHDASSLVFGNRLARFELAMLPEVAGTSGASAVSYMGAAGSKLTIYIMPPDRFPAPAEEGEFFGAIAGIMQLLPQVEAESVGSFLLAEDDQQNLGRIATFSFKAQDRVMGTLLIVVGARQHILKFRATYPSADEQKALVHVGESISELLGQEIELVTKPAK